MIDLCSEGWGGCGKMEGLDDRLEDDPPRV